MVEPIKMSRAEYQTKYGVEAPAVPVADTKSTGEPIKMSRAEYQTKYGMTAPKKETVTSGGDFDFASELPDNLMKDVSGTPQEYAAREAKTRWGVDRIFGSQVLAGKPVEGIGDIATGAGKAAINAPLDALQFGWGGIKMIASTAAGIGGAAIDIAKGDFGKAGQDISKSPIGEIIRDPAQLVGEVPKQIAGGIGKGISAYQAGEGGGKAWEEVSGGLQKALVSFEDHPISEFISLKGLMSGVGKGIDIAKEPSKAAGEAVGAIKDIPSTVRSAKDSVYGTFTKTADYLSKNGKADLLTKWQKIRDTNLQHVTNLKDSVSQLALIQKGTAEYDKAIIQRDLLKKKIEENASKNESVHNAVAESVMNKLQNESNNREAIDAFSTYGEESKKKGSLLYYQALKDEKGNDFQIKDNAIADIADNIAKQADVARGTGDTKSFDLMMNEVNEIKLLQLAKESKDTGTPIRELTDNEELLKLYDKRPGYYDKPIVANDMSARLSVLRDKIKESSPGFVFTKFDNTVGRAFENATIDAIGGKDSIRGKKLQEATDYHREVTTHPIWDELKKVKEKFTRKDVDAEKSGVKTLTDYMPFVQEHLPIVANMIQNHIAAKILIDAKDGDTFNTSKLLKGIKDNQKVMKSDHIEMIMEIVKGLDESAAEKKSIDEMGKAELSQSEAKIRELEAQLKLTGTNATTFAQSIRSIKSPADLQAVVNATNKTPEEIGQLYLSIEWEEVNKTSASNSEKLKSFLDAFDKVGGKREEALPGRSDVRKQMFGNQEATIAEARTAQKAFEELENYEVPSAAKAAMQVVLGTVLTQIGHALSGIGLVKTGLGLFQKTAKLKTATSALSGIDGLPEIPTISKIAGAGKEQKDKNK